MMLRNELALIHDTDSGGVGRSFLLNNGTFTSFDPSRNRRLLGCIWDKSRRCHRSVSISTRRPRSTDIFGRRKRTARSYLDSDGLAVTVILYSREAIFIELFSMWIQEGSLAVGTSPRIQLQKQSCPHLLSHIAIVQVLLS